MLKLLGRLERTRGIIIVGFAILMAVSLIFFWTPGRGGNVAATKNTAVLAKVGSDQITVAQLARLKEGYAQMFGGRIPPQMGGDKNFLEGLIRERVIAQEAERLELGASDDEVADKIRNIYKDPSGQFVGLERYKELVSARIGDLEEYEKGIRMEIAREKLKAFVTSAVTISDAEVQEEYERKNTFYDLTYAVISAEKLAEKIQPTDEDLKKYYEQHKTEYRFDEPQKKIRYVYIDQDKSGQKLAITDKDLRDEFGKMSPQGKQAGVKVQQILLKVARKDLDAQVEQKAKDLLAKLAAASKENREQVFADLARGNSEDPATAKVGGWLPRPVKKNPNKADALYDRAVDMEEGQVFDIPIKFGGNWYLLRRGPAVEKTFEEAKPELLASLRNRRGYTVASQLAERAKNRLKETKDPQKVAQELAAEANMKPAEMVRETPFVKPGDDVPEIGSSQQFEAAIEPLNNPGDVGEQTGVKGGFAIPMLAEKKEPRIPEFEEVKTKVAETLKQELAREQLNQKANEIASSLSSPTDIKTAAEKAGLKSATEEGYQPGRALGEAGTSPALDEALHALKAGGVTKVPVKVGDSWVVLGVTKRENADLAAFAGQRNQLMSTILDERKNQVFEDYIRAAHQRMKQEGKIKIYQDVLASIQEAEPEISAPLPQLPLPAQ
jgi:peptidyl-prolyl cis-trans isomerase D